MWHSLPVVNLGVHALMIDLPGHGESKLSKTQSPELGIKQMAIDVIEVLDYLGIEDFDIVGHSMGGYVALEVKRLNVQCGKVVLLNSNYWTDHPTKVIDRKRIANLVLKSKTFFIQKAIPSLFVEPNEFKQQVDELIKEANEMDPKAIAHASLAMASRTDFTEIMAVEDLFVIHGALDRLVFSQQFETHKRILAGHFFELKKAGHMSHIESPDEVSAVLDLILNKSSNVSNTSL